MKPTISDISLNKCHYYCFLKFSSFNSNGSIIIQTNSFKNINQNIEISDKLRKKQS